jgi:hypothetical protein
MNGRYRSKEGINYPFDSEISQLDKKLHLNIDFDSILKEGYKIIVLNHQPGIGKTYTVMDYIMKKCKEDDTFTFFYFTDKHKTIDEHLRRLGEEAKRKKENKPILETFAHWKGFGKYSENEQVEKYLSLNLPRDIVIKHFKLEKCYEEYLKQFDNTKRVFAPFYYLSDECFLNNPPKIVFLDESITQIETYSFNRDKIVKGLEFIKAPPEYIEKAKCGDKEYFLNEDVLDNIRKLYQRRLIGALNNETKKLDQFEQFNPYLLRKYLEFSKIYQYKNNLYSQPLFYKAFDAVQRDIPIVILDASFNINLFSYFLESYNGEMEKLKEGYKGFKDLKIKILKSNVSNKDTVIYRMHPIGSMTKTSLTDFSDTTWQWLLQELKEIKEVFGDANIGVITYQELSWLFEAMNFDVEHYGALRGSNILENKPVLVIVGAWLPLPPSWEDKKNFSEDKDYIDILAEKYFLIKVSESDVETVRVGPNIGIEKYFHNIYSSDSKARITMSVDKKIFEHDGIKRYFKITDADKVAEYPINTINTIWFDESYQSFHRNRGLRYPRIIFSYAWFPERKMSMWTKDNGMMPELLFKSNLRGEFPSMLNLLEDTTQTEFTPTIKKVLNVDQRKKILEYYKEYYKGGAMQRLMKHIELDENSIDIADEFSINKKGDIRSRDTQVVTKLKRAYKNIKKKL